MDYVNVRGYGDIVEVYRYEKRPFRRSGGARPQRTLGTTSLIRLLKDGQNVVSAEQPKKARQASSIKRAVLDFRRLVGANLVPAREPVLASLTYRENTQDLEQGRIDFGAFARDCQRVFGPEFKYIVVFEFQRRGALHFHALLWGVPASYVRDERSTRLIASLWKRGFVDLVQTDGSKKIGTYLSKYLAKSFADPSLSGRKAYISSRNCLRPWKDTDTILAPYFMGENARGVDLSTAELLQEKEYETQWLGRAIYKQYLTNPYASKNNNDGYGSNAV